jgi:hypothetical protein
MLIAFVISVVSPLGCSSGANRTDSSYPSLISAKTQEELRIVAPSVVGVGAMDEYTVTVFNHALVGNRFVKDAASPTGYRLSRGTDAITTKDTTIEVHGSGLIIYHDERKAIVLTSRHTLYASDTLSTYYRDSLGNATDVLCTRAIRKQSQYFINDQNNFLKVATVLHTDVKSDLGLISVETKMPIGSTLPLAVGYRTKLDWGDLAFIFGFPKQVKQLAFGVISPAPYPGNFVVDAVTRFGYSGGPILVVRPDGSLELAGITRALPVSQVQYAEPPTSVLLGGHIAPDEMLHLKAQQLQLIEYGTVYGIGTEKIGRFLEESRDILEKKGVRLMERFLPP